MTESAVQFFIIDFDILDDLAAMPVACVELHSTVMTKRNDPLSQTESITQFDLVSMFLIIQKSFNAFY